MHEGESEVSSLMSAYILIQTDVGKESDVAGALAVIPGIDSVAITLGPYEVIAHATTLTLDGFTTLILRRVQSVQGVERTVTCPALRVA